ncbi:hypothetical protein, partial [Fischerella sp. PCC 9605]|uniref:hypothetical protein n=1 Tax=Fischerella sp. PCC 9605 TaxID=1173024 RepID=UPI0004B54E85
MVSSQNRHAVAVFSSRQDAEGMLNELINAGFSTDQISIVVNESDINHLDEFGRNDFFSYQDPPKGYAAITGSMLGAICGCLLGLGLIAVPGVGSAVLAIGSSQTVLTASLAGFGIGVASGGLLEALVNAGISAEQARVYSECVFRGDYLVIVNGTDEEVHDAESILNQL